MSKTANQLVIDAIYQSGLIPQENQSIPAYMIAQGMTLLNDIILMWGSDTSLAPYQNEVRFNFVANQERYTFGIGDQYDVNTQPMIDITSFTYNVGPGSDSNLFFQCEQMNEPQYASILYRNVSTYPGQYLMRCFPEYTEIIVQPLPQDAYPVQLLLKARLPTIQQYEDLECKFPPGFLLNLKYQLMLDYMDAFGMEPSPAFILKAQTAFKSMQGNNKIDLYSRKSETISNRTRQYYPFTAWM